MTKPTLAQLTLERNALQSELELLKQDFEALKHTPRRRKLPDERAGSVTHFVIKAPEGDEGGYLIVGCYEDGTVGEFFVKMSKQGSTVSGFVDQWAIACSLLLQTGTPLEDLCRRFIGTSFSPSGRTNLAEARLALSPVDLVAKLLYWRYVKKCLPEEG